MTTTYLLNKIKYAPSYAWDKYSESSIEDTIWEIVNYLNSLKVGTKLKVGSITQERYDPWTLEKVSISNWKGFHYDWDEGIKDIAMAEHIFRHLKASGYYIIKEV